MTASLARSMACGTQESYSPRTRHTPSACPSTMMIHARNAARPGFCPTPTRHATSRRSGRKSPVKPVAARRARLRQSCRCHSPQARPGGPLTPGGWHDALPAYAASQPNPSDKDSHEAASPTFTVDVDFLDTDLGPVESGDPLAERIEDSVAEALEKRTSTLPQIPDSVTTWRTSSPSSRTTPWSPSWSK